ncbi:hypothetical protein [Shouchella miscanthi]|uniref:DUF4352 domain-containing protein n=1 Tax=Shouchella miscanthi TaxID=2598861 RepID=A0ABU6NGQ2_9BACI|nr:hypothetical protein [Shouchella miscanthi]
MNKWSFSGITVALLMATACTSSDSVEEGTEQDKSNENETEYETVLEEEEREEGTFSVYERFTDVTANTEGPVEMTITQIDLGMADLEGFVAATTGDETIDYVEMMLTIENASDETMYVPYGEASLEANTGEKVETVSLVLSDDVEPHFEEGDTKEVRLLFPLESIQGVTELTFSMNGPSTDLGGDQLTEEIELSFMLAS